MSTLQYYQWFTINEILTRHKIFQKKWKMKNDINQFLYNAEKCSNILKTSLGIHVTRF